VTLHRQHPRRGPRPGLFVAGGNPRPEDLPSDPPAGGDLEPSAAGNLPAVREEDVVHPAYSPALSAEARRLIDWDQSVAVEPYQLDITRGLEDTVRMGNSLSAAVRLELLADRMREETLDRPGPGWPADEEAAPFTDEVSGAELDPVDGLPIGADEDAEDADALEAFLAHDDEPAPALQLVDSPPEYGGVRPVAMMFAAARATGGVPRRMLDWASRHDPASLDYLVRDKLRAPAPLVDRLWEHGPILDQGTAPPLSLHDASGCTGHAAANAANVLELATVSPYARVHPADLMAHADAMKLYELAQTLDEVPGENYPGTSVLAAMKAGVQLGWWGSYLWARGTKDVAQALLQVGPVVVGIPWYSRMSEPGADGIITVAGEDLGGHALCLFAIRMAVAGKAGPWFGALQSWGESVGDHGVIWFHHKDLANLLHGVGEAAIPIPAAGGPV
jgi:hypothetical protein